MAKSSEKYIIYAYFNKNGDALKIGKTANWFQRASNLYLGNALPKQLATANNSDKAWYKENLAFIQHASIFLRENSAVGKVVNKILTEASKPKSKRSAVSMPSAWLSPTYGKANMKRACYIPKLMKEIASLASKNGVFVA